MATHLPITLSRLMSDIDKPMTITKNTAISMGLALLLATGYGIMEVRHANTVNDISNLKDENLLIKNELKEIQNGYVTKRELNNTLKLIELQLQTISEKISK